MKIVWTEHALNCLTDIEEYIAQDDPAAAVFLVEKLIARTDILKDYPEAGRRVPELPNSRLREVVEGNHRIVYRVQQQVIEILMIFESHRQCFMPPNS
ncbi:type II toxin-antitoxin system RelE/ParE family toxin [Geoalkalibacter sp.]|uniref:type II toxin-antitoxin system RelE/ParE family toxin n=1 Tax=Geoalkalibacter sp. TaxID=3041440 RepID=UPI00272E02ED|nr:type II toxin-antitoxin system RelE/ParE family toxin [Geoalkalibacter sp.]